MSHPGRNRKSHPEMSNQRMGCVRKCLSLLASSTDSVCVCYGSTGRDKRTGHASGTRDRHGGATRGRVHTNQSSDPVCVTGRRDEARGRGT
eukprot:1322785-Prymnesium_polylepis.1